VERRHGAVSGEDRNPGHHHLPECRAEDAADDRSGTRWEYGTNIDFVGKAVEAVSGKRLDAYLHGHLFTPLGMSDNRLSIGEPQRKRLVAMHQRGEDASLDADPFELEQNPEFHMGGGGLYGTAGDYIRFTQMILNKGRGNGNQVLSPRRSR